MLVALPERMDDLYGCQNAQNCSIYIRKLQETQVRYHMGANIKTT